MQFTEESIIIEGKIILPQTTPLDLIGSELKRKMDKCVNKKDELRELIEDIEQMEKQAKSKGWNDIENKLTDIKTKCECSKNEIEEDIKDMEKKIFERKVENLYNKFQELEKSYDTIKKSDPKFLIK